MIARSCCARRNKRGFSIALRRLADGGAFHRNPQRRPTAVTPMDEEPPRTTRRGAAATKGQSRATHGTLGIWPSDCSVDAVGPMIGEWNQATPRGRLPSRGAFNREERAAP